MLTSTLLTPITEANIWQERRAATQKGSQLYAQLTQPKNANFQTFNKVTPTLDLDTHFSKRITSSSTKSSEESLPEWAARVVAPYGTIQSTFLSSSKNSPLIIHVQDAHEVEDAQRNIAGLIEKLNTEKNHVFVGLEGAEGAFNTQAYRNFVSADVTKAMADFFLTNGYITGAEYAGLTMKEMPTLWGIENLSTYSKNIEAYKKSIHNKADVEKQLGELKSDLNTRKQKFYSNELKSFDHQYENYHQGRLSIGSYVTYLLNQAPAPARPTLNLFQKTLSLEKSLNFGQIEAERTNLIQNLVSKLKPAQISELLGLSQKYQERELTYADYYSYLKNLCSDTGLNIHQYPQFLAYVEYVIQAEKINSNTFMAELAQQETVVRDCLIRTPDQKNTLALSQLVVLMEGLTDHRMLESDWALYQGLNKNVKSISAGLAELLTPFESFYALATKRNSSLVENLLAQNKSKVAMMVTGGFHTEGITKILREKNISYIVVTPKISKIDPHHNALDVFARDPRPIEKIFAGNTIFLVAPLTTAKNLPGTAAVRAQTLHRMMAISAPVLESLIRGIPNAQLRGFLMTKWSEATGRFPNFSVAYKSSDKKGKAVRASARVGNTIYTVMATQGSARNTTDGAVAVELNVAGQPASVLISAENQRDNFVSLPELPNFLQAVINFILVPFDYCWSVAKSGRFSIPHRMMAATGLAALMGLGITIATMINSLGTSSGSSLAAAPLLSPWAGRTRGKKEKIITDAFLRSTKAKQTDPAHIISGSTKLLNHRDLKPGEFYFEDRYIKLFPLAYHFLNIYGRSKGKYQGLRPIADKFKRTTVSVGATNDPYYDIYGEQNEIRINKDFLEFMLTSGRKKIFMSFMAGAVLDLQKERGEINLGNRQFAQHKYSIDVLLSADRESLFPEHKGLRRKDGRHPTRLDDTKYLYLLKNRVAQNDPKEESTVKFKNRYFLTDEDILLIISDIMGRGRSIDARRLSKFLIEEYGHYGEITEQRARALLTQFQRLNKKVVDITEFSEKGDIEELKKKLADGAKINENASVANVAKALIKHKLYTLSAKYRTDPAFEPEGDQRQYTVTDIEADRIDEVHLGGKSAHTGEMLFAPHVVSLPAFFSYGRTFSHLLESNSNVAVYKERLEKRYSELEQFLTKAEKSPEKYTQLSSQDLHEFRKDMVVRFGMDMDEDIEKHPILKQLRETLTTMDQVLAGINGHSHFKSITDYFAHIGDDLDATIKGLKKNKENYENEKAELNARILKLEQRGDSSSDEITSLRNQIQQIVTQLESTNEEMERKSASEANKLLIAARNLIVPEDVVQEVKQELRSLAERLGIPVQDLIIAIRSSAVGEDSELASFAGRLTTWIFQSPFVNEKDEEGLDYLISAWVAVQSSLFNKRANDYRLDHGLKTYEKGVEVSSPFQDMFRSVFSFIGFSVEGESGFPALTISVGPGQGELLVNGTNAGSKYIYTNDGQLLLQRKRAEGDQVKLVTAASGRRLERVNLTDAEKAEFAMTDEKPVEAISRCIKELHRFYEGYVDTEGALAPKKDITGNEISLDGADRRGRQKKDWAVVFTQVRPETVRNLEDNNSLKLQKIMVSQAAFDKANAEGRVLDFEFIARSAGTAQGEIVYVMDKSPKSLSKAQGRIMLTMQSDPDMNSAMIAAKGIVAILGGPNSHTMIVAKEYGLVAITGTKEQLLSYLKNGDKVTIDAERGKILLGYDHALEVSGNDFSVRNIPDSKPGKIRSATIVATMAKAFKQWALSKIPSYKGVGLMRLEIVLTDVIKVYPEFLMAYDNYYKRLRGEQIQEGAPVLDESVIRNAEDPKFLEMYSNLQKKEINPDSVSADAPLFERSNKDHAKIIKDIEDIRALRATITGYNSGEEFYKETLSKWIRAHAETLNAPKEEVVTRAQKIPNDFVRQRVLDVVQEYFKMGLGFEEPLNELKEIRADTKGLTPKEKKLLDEIIGLLNKRLYIRLDDRKSDEYGNVIGASRYLKEEHNAMMGFRGLDLLLRRPHTTAWQLDAIYDVAKDNRHKIGVFAPVVRRPEDMRDLLQMMDDHGLTRDRVKRGMMTEIPTNAINIRDFLETGIDFISTGGNDGLQTIKKQDRNTGDAKLKATGSDFDVAFLRWNAMIVSEVQKYNKEHGTHIECGFCGNAPSVPGQEVFAAVLQELGYDSVSVVIEAYEPVATNITKSNDQWKKLEQMGKVKAGSMVKLLLGQDQKGFQFELNTNAAPQQIHYKRMDIESIRMKLPFHYRYIELFDQGQLEQKNEIYEAISKWKKQGKTAMESYSDFVFDALSDFVDQINDTEGVVMGSDDGESRDYRKLLGGSDREPKEANPSLGLHGMVKVLEYDMAFFEAELKALKILKDAQPNREIGVALRTVRTADEVKKARDLIRKTTGTDIKIGIDVTVAGNLFELDTLLAQENNVAFVSIDNPRELTSQLMTLETDNTNGVDITVQDVQYQLAIPREALKTATERRGIAYHELADKQPGLSQKLLQPGALFAPLIAVYHKVNSFSYISYVLIAGPLSETILFATLQGLNHSFMFYINMTLIAALVHVVIIMWAQKLKNQPWDAQLLPQGLFLLLFFSVILVPFQVFDNALVASLVSGVAHSGINFSFLLARLPNEQQDDLARDIDSLLPPLELASTNAATSVQAPQKAQTKIDVMGLRFKLYFLFAGVQSTPYSYKDTPKAMDDLLFNAQKSKQGHVLGMVSQMGTAGEIDQELVLLSNLTAEIKQAKDVTTMGTKLALWAELISRRTPDRSRRESVIKVTGAFMQKVVDRLDNKPFFPNEWARFRTDYEFGRAIAKNGNVQTLQDVAAVKNPSDFDANRAQLPLFHLPENISVDDNQIAMKQASRFIHQMLAKNQAPQLTFISNRNKEDILKALRLAYAQDLPTKLQIRVVSEDAVSRNGLYSYDQLFNQIKSFVPQFEFAVNYKHIEFPMWSPVLAQWQFADPTSTRTIQLTKLILIQVISGNMAIVATLDAVITEMKAQIAAAQAA